MTSQAASSILDPRTPHSPSRVRWPRQLWALGLFIWSTVDAAVAWREREPCRFVAGRLYAILLAFFSLAFQFSEASPPPYLVFESEVFDVGETIGRRLHSEPVDIGFNKAVLFH
jgi:hypothetical protein